jgi:hypothetical protein
VYCGSFQTVADEEDNNQVSYIKLINVGQKVITRNCTGYVPSQVAFYLQNIHILPRKIYLTLNAEVMGNDSGSNHSLVSLGGINGIHSSRLSETGLQYSLDLAKYIYSRQETLTDLSKAVFVLAGTTSVHAETILHLRNLFPCFTTTLLNDLRVGDVKDDWQVLYFQHWYPCFVSSLYVFYSFCRESRRLIYDYVGMTVLCTEREKSRTAILLREFAQ